MDTKMILVGVAVVAVFVAAGLFVSSQTAPGTPQASPVLQTEAGQEDTRNIEMGVNAIATAEVTKSDGSMSGTTHTIEMSSSGFSPSELTVKAGDTVTFLAIDTSNRWPASAFHPKHTVYPGSDIEKCGTDEEDIIFDSCGAVAEGQSWSFKFDEKGTWAYHDHESSKDFGKIIVE
jgi:plastocyanin